MHGIRGPPYISKIWMQSKLCEGDAIYDAKN